VALQILIWMLPIDLFSRIMRYALIAIDREHSVTSYYGIGLLLNAAMNFILIPKFSYIGAAWASIITQAFLLTAQGILYFHSSKMKLGLPYFRIVLGNMLLYGALYLWSAKIYWMAGIIIGLAFFALQMVLFGVIRKKDFAAIFS
jgi:O-antigen/teichoic acid export membrane protein